jgi:hypothetical protein
MFTTRHRFHYRACQAALSLCLWPAVGEAQTAVTGFTVSTAGTNGNPVLTTPTVAITGPGTFTTGPLVGPNGNTSRTSATVDFANPLPSVSLFATGGDPAGFTGTVGFATARLAYHFTVHGPIVPGLLVPILFSGATFASVVQTGDPSQFFSTAGTSVEIDALHIGNSFRNAGTTGTLPTVSPAGQLNPNGEILGWGSRAAAPVGYVDYTSSYLFEADLTPGDVGSIAITGTVQGGVTGLLRPTGVPTFGTATAFVDPLISIDPTFLALHPEYSIVVDAGIGNGGVAAVPEPSSLALMMAGAFALVAYRRQWRKRPDQSARRL